jgi:hypothetical protein
VRLHPYECAARIVTASVLAVVVADSCYHHSQKWGAISIDDNLQASAFFRWYSFHGTPLAKRLWEHARRYPCQDCCLKPRKAVASRA